MIRRSDIESRVEECPYCAFCSESYCDRHLGMIVELPEEDRKWFLSEEEEVGS